MSKEQGRNLDKLGVIDESGSRTYMYPADVKGRFTKLKPFVHYALIAIYAALPWIRVGDNPAVLIDIPMRRFYLFGAVFNAQDFYLAFYILTGIGFSLILISALFGRVWCGWACPQTVFLESVFRKIERVIEGPHQKRIALQNAPWTGEKIMKRALKHGIYVVMALAVSHIFLSYFVSMPRLLSMVASNPAENLTAFMWMAAVTGILYFNFWWFREQLCIIICPYGRLQSVLQDDDTIVIGYDEKRGEPRGKAKDTNAGDCVDCGRCVAVCPTGIDIRNGLQLECIGCANCIDACDEIMEKLKRPTGLVRYDSQKGFTGVAKRFLRPRVLYYAIAGAVGASVATFMWVNHSNFEANVLHLQGAPYVIEGDTLRNQLMVHVINKNSDPSKLHVEAPAGQNMTFTIPQPSVDLKPLMSHQLPVIVEMPRAAFTKGTTAILDVTDSASGDERRVYVEILGPTMKAPSVQPAGAPAPGAVP